jgi:hypothetical protein
MLLVAFTAFVRIHFYIVSDHNQRTIVTNTPTNETYRDDKASCKDINYNIFPLVFGIHGDIF